MSCAIWCYVCSVSTIAYGCAYADVRVFGYYRYI